LIAVAMFLSSNRLLSPMLDLLKQSARNRNAKHLSFAQYIV